MRSKGSGRTSQSGLRGGRRSSGSPERARRVSARTSPTVPTSIDGCRRQGRFVCLPARTPLTRSPSSSARWTCSLAARRIPGVAALPPLGLRERCARPRAETGRPLARRRDRTGSAPHPLRPLAPASRAPEHRRSPPASGSLPGYPSQARPHERLGRPAGGRACGSGSRRRRRSEGRLPGHTSTSRRTLGSTGASPRRFRLPGSRIRT